MIRLRQPFDDQAHTTTAHRAIAGGGKPATRARRTAGRPKEAAQRHAVPPSPLLIQPSPGRACRSCTATPWVSVLFVCFFSISMSEAAGDDAGRREGKEETPATVEAGREGGGRGGGGGAEAGGRKKRPFRHKRRSWLFRVQGVDINGERHQKKKSGSRWQETGVRATRPTPRPAPPATPSILSLPLSRP